jgi:hypothetical protein
MSDQPGANLPGAIWRNQPKEKLAVELEQVVTRRADAMHSSTRSEILASIGAAILLAGVVAWRFAPAYSRLLEIGFAAVLVWVAITVAAFRNWIRQSGESASGSVAVPSLAYYRSELERRRDHLRNAWLWHGPLLLALLICAAIVTSAAFSSGARLRGVLPLVVVLVLWTASGLRRRLRQARQLQQEIREVDQLLAP